MLLKSLEIKNFRGFKQVEVEKLGDVNLIVGQNNVGKSSFLEALEIYANNGTLDSFYKIAKRRNELVVDIKSPEQRERVDLRNFFYNWNTDYSTFEAVRTGQNNTSIGEPKSASQLTIDHWYVFTDSATGSINIAGPEFGNHSAGRNSTVRDEFKRKKGNDDIDLGHNKKYPPIRHSAVPTGNCPLEELAELWDHIALNPHEEKVLAAINIIEPKIKKMAFVKAHSYTTSRVPIVRLEGTAITVPLTSMGDGMLRVLQISLNAIQAEGGILLIDEFENGLHHSTQKKIWEFIFSLAKDLNIQVFATTHSLDCLKAFSAVAQERTDLEGVALGLGRSARKSNKGEIIATVMDEESLSHLLSMEYEVR
ncbi:MAG: AAA family ATPase [Marinagarivorans sp.]